nr:leucine-rich repeat transmembrane neuronal protein 2-like [Pocillopora verrucosa]
MARFTNSYRVVFPLGQVFSLIVKRQVYGGREARKGEEWARVLDHNRLKTIGDGTFKQFISLERCSLRNNNLTSVPDLKRLTFSGKVNLENNQITDVTKIVTSGIQIVFELYLRNNKIEYLPPNIFQNTIVVANLDLSFNNLQSLPDNVFDKLDKLDIL